MQDPSAAVIHTIVEAVDEEDMLVVLRHVAVKSDVLAGIDLGLAAQKLLAMLREASEVNANAERALSLLTKRERQVAELLRSGMSNTDMASVLGCTERTIRAHLENMQRKLRSPNRTALLASVNGLNIGGSANTRI
ncbi:NarL/FixJ family DNA-binding response regulator [Chromobacterium vaccinii]|nr:NarL/FixJ family DNA-binding response regulator [Chromobacterium vaccinii]QND89898.1 NarL/FixJ family DNA-binding response regulator [Chromobacterium vaccinii]